MAMSKRLYEKIMKEGKECFDAFEEYDKTGKLPVEIEKRIAKKLKEEKLEESVRY